MLLFSVRRDPFGGLIEPLVLLLIVRRIPDVVRQFLVFLPDMPSYRFHTILGMGAKMPCRTARTYLWITLVFPVGRAVRQWLILRAEDTVVRFVIHRFPPPTRARPLSSGDVCMPWIAPGHRQTLSYKCAGSCTPSLPLPFRCRRDFFFYLFLQVCIGLGMCPIYIYHLWRKVSCFGRFFQKPYTLSTVSSVNRRRKAP